MYIGGLLKNFSLMGCAIKSLGTTDLHGQESNTGTYKATERLIFVIFLIHSNHILNMKIKLTMNYHMKSPCKYLIMH